MSTIYEIAKIAKVSPATVSQVLSGRRQMKWPSKAKKAAHIREIADRLGYRPNGGARALRAKKTCQIGVLLVNSPERPLHYPASFEFMMGINQRLESHGYVLSIVRISEFQHEGQSQSRVFQESILEGMIVINRVGDDVAAKIREAVGHTVWLDGNWSPQNCVRRDEFAAGQLAATEACEAGYKRIVWATALSNRARPAHYSSTDRREGVRSIAEASGVEMVDCVMPAWDEALEPDALAACMIPGTAIVAYDPFSSIRICSELMARGIAVGRKVGLVSCDGTHETLMAMPGMSHVMFDRFLMGQTAADLMLAAIGGKEMPSRELAGTWNAGNTLISSGL